MGLTVGSGPFGQHPGGTFNFELPRAKGKIYFEDSPRRIRARLGGETVVDSRHAKLLHEQNLLPIYYFPEEEVRMDLLVPSEKHTRCPYKGEASYWSLPDVEDVAWFYPAPLREAGEVKDRIAFFDEFVDVVVDGDRHERPVTPWSRR